MGADKVPPRSWAACLRCPKHYVEAPKRHALGRLLPGAWRFVWPRADFPAYPGFPEFPGVGMGSEVGIGKH